MYSYIVYLYIQVCCVLIYIEGLVEEVKRLKCAEAKNTKAIEDLSQQNRKDLHVLILIYMYMYS